MDSSKIQSAIKNINNAIITFRGILEIEQSQGMFLNQQQIKSNISSLIASKRDLEMTLQQIHDKQNRFININEDEYFNL